MVLLQNSIMQGGVIQGVVPVFKSLRVLLLNWGYIAIMQLHFFMTTITYIYNLKILCKLQILSLHALIHIS